MAASNNALPFQQLTPHVAVGANPPSGWRAAPEFPILILVGVTGVGKSTLLAELSRELAYFLLLPDRRRLTDELIISAMQAAAGAPIEPISDRGQRFAYTRRYRELYGGGMAHALTQLWIGPDAPDLLLFDGLRGDNEVRYAAAALPQARFVMLDAPELVRLQRLLGRNDAFDRVQVGAAPAVATVTSMHATANNSTFAEWGVPEAEAIFTPSEEATILNWVQQGVVTPDQVRAKVQIVIEERRNYDPAATRNALRTHAPQRTLYIDTVTYTPAATAEKVMRWLTAGNQ